ncbi:MAG: hypothetical protein ACE5FD_16315 [Anaerolineae bacterium]
MFNTGERIGLIIRLSLSSIFIIVGVLVTWLLPRAINRETTRVVAAAVVTATNLKDAPLGGEVLK